MVKPFRFARIPIINFGAGKIDLLPGIIKTFGNNIILVTGKKSFISSPVSISIFDAFEKEGIRHRNYIISGEPSPGAIDNAVKEIGREKFEVVVSIGGGSVIDAGKALSAMIYRKESICDFLEGPGNKEHPGTKLTFIAVPTTSGTGSEATKNAVISSIGKQGFKRSLRHDNFVPDMAIVDPKLTISCPGSITAASGMDCFTQLTEAYLSDKANDFTDMFALRGLEAIKTSLTRSYLDGHDIAARNGMSFAALTSGICLANAGLGVVHGFASSLGGMHDIPHGVICGTLMAVANEVNIRKLRKESGNDSALKKYASLGRLFLDEELKGDDYYIDGFVRYLYSLNDELKLPRLGKYGINENEIDEICSATECKNNPVKLNMEELKEIISRRI
jgi:alcohol dehydrogenase class IV